MSGIPYINTIITLFTWAQNDYIMVATSCICEGYTMATKLSKAYEQHPSDPLAGYESAVTSLQLKLARIAKDSQLTCGHLSRAAAALRSISRARVETRLQQNA